VHVGSRTPRALQPEIKFLEKVGQKMNNKKDLAISFNDAHDKIVQAAAKVGLYLYEFCKALKDMKESKLYLSAGYESFEDYCLRALNIKKSQAYTYLKICDVYSPRFFQSNGKIGITKLELLSALPEDEAEAFIKTNNVENLSVKDVKKTLASYQDKKDLKEISEAVEIIDIEEVEENKIYNSFGAFLKDKRLERGNSLRQCARGVDVPHSYIANIEAGRRLPHNQAFYNKLIFHLGLTPYEQKEMFILVENEFKAKNKLSPRVVSYLTTNNDISKIITASIDNNLTSEKVNKIIKIIEAL